MDWSRGMVSQIASLGPNYAEWVNKPVDRPLRLFDTTALEMLTKTPWWLVPGFWIPIIIILIKIGINDAHGRHYGNVSEKMNFRIIIFVSLAAVCVYRVDL